MVARTLYTRIIIYTEKVEIHDYSLWELDKAYSTVTTHWLHCSPRGAGARGNDEVQRAFVDVEEEDTACDTTDGHST
jgi:hypothetical protein